MKKSIKFMTAAMAVLALASCSNDDFLSEGQRATVANKGEMIVEVDPLDNAGVGTRAYRDASTDGFLQFVSTDKIRVYDNKLQNFDIYKSNDNGTKFFVEGEQGVKGSDAAYALFPADMVKRGYLDKPTGKTFADYIIPEVITYDENSEYDAEEKGVYYASNLPMFGKVTSTADGGLKVTGMRHVCAVVKISLENAYTNATYLRLTTMKALDGDPEAKPMSGTFTAALTTDEATRKDVKLEAMEDYDDVKRYPDLYIDLRKVPSPTSVIYIPVVPGLDGDVDDVKLMYTMTDMDDPKDIALEDWRDSGCKFPNHEMKQNSLYKAGHAYELKEMSPNKVSQLLEQYKNSKSDIEINVTEKFLIDDTENGWIFNMPKLADGVNVTLNLADMKGGVENAGAEMLEIISADDENPFTGKFTINVGDKVKGSADVFSFNNIDMPKANIELAGDYTDQTTLNVWGAKVLSLGDGETTSVFAPTTTAFTNIETFAVRTNATATFTDGIIFDKFIKAVEVESDGILKADVTTPAEAAEAIVEIDGTMYGNLTVGGVKSNVFVAGEGQIQGNVDMEAVKKGELFITSKGKKLGADKMVAIQGDVTASCNVNVNMAEEGIAVNGNLFMKGAAKKVNLDQGYIRLLNVDVQNAGDWESKKVDLVFGAGNVALKFIQITKDNILTYNSSKWNGKTMGAPYVADYRTTQYNMENKYMFTATQLSVTDAFAAAALQINNDIDMANFKYAGIKENTDAALVVDGTYTADEKLVYVDAKAGQKVFTISNLNYEKIGTGLFNKFAGNKIENLNIAGVKSEKAATAQKTVGGLIGEATGAANIGFVNVTGIKLAAEHNIGGLIGTSNGASNIYNCSVAGEIKGGYALGGLVGLVKAAILAEESDASGITFKQDFDSGKTMDIKYAKVGGFFGTVENKASVLITSGKAPASINYDKKAKMYVSDVDESLGNFYDYKANQNFIGYSGHVGSTEGVTIAGINYINGESNKYMVPKNFKNEVTSGYKALYTWVKR